jgi:RHS repeat-associated protein
MSEKYVVGSTTTWHDYIQTDGHIIAEKFSGGTTAMRYFVLDHLGSVAVVMDDAGTVLERLSYDAWGQRRCANGTGNASCFTGSSTTRGFTNQEEMDEIGLVNLNARIYDPVLGRFMSADSVVQDVYGPQTLNRYSYVGNNPLSFTDPTGHFFGIDDMVEAIIVIAVDVGIAEITKNVPILSDLMPIILCGEDLLCAATDTAVNAGVKSGKAGIALKAFVFSYAEGKVFNEVGTTVQDAKLGDVGMRIATFVSHGAVGGLLSVASGQKFGSGFLAAGVGSLADGAPTYGPTVNGVPIDGVIEHAVLGGAGSILGGGKFANGAVTGAFGYLFNYCDHHPCNALAADTENRAKQDYGLSDARLDPIHAQAANNIKTGDTALEVTFDVADLLFPVSEGGELAKELFDRTVGAVFGMRSATEEDRIDNEFARRVNALMTGIDLEKSGLFVPAGGGVSVRDDCKMFGCGQ